MNTVYRNLLSPAAIAILSSICLGILPVSVDATVIKIGCAGGNLGDDCSLSELFQPGASIQANDKLFDNWRLIGNGSSSGGGGEPPPPLPDLGEILVTPLDNGGNDPGPGLRFTDTDDNWRIQNNVGAFSKTILTTFEFDVTALDGLIKDNTLKLIAFGQGGLIGNLYELGVTERLFDGAGNPIFDDPKRVFSSTVTGQQTLDRRNFAPTKFVRVRKDVRLFTDPMGVAFIRTFEQRFSQVPEPSTFFLFGIGLASLGFRNRKRK